MLWEMGCYHIGVLVLFYFYYYNSFKHMQASLVKCAPGLPMSSHCADLLKALTVQTFYDAHLAVTLKHVIFILAYLLCLNLITEFHLCAVFLMFYRTCMSKTFLSFGSS